jgi:hypothetical protein
MKNICLVIAIAAGLGSASAQDSIFAKFVFHNQSQPFALNELITATNGVDYRIEDLAFYLSRVELTHDGGQVTEVDSNKVFYVNYNAPVINLGQYTITSLESIRFTVGVPNYLNHLDISQYPEGHPLSYHTPPMHWGWSAGYIFFLMNGYGDHDDDGTATQVYQLNCLGDHNAQTVDIPTVATVYPDNTQQIVLICNVDEWLRGSDPATTGPLHGDTGLNETVMDNVNDYPVFVSPAAASVVDQQQLDVKVMQSQNDITLSWGETAVDSYRLLDAEGRLLAKGRCDQHGLSFSNLGSGWHLVQLYAENDVLMGTAKWIVP